MTYTTLNSAPERIAIMARDASNLIKYCAWLYQETLDSSMRPAALVEVPEEEYTTVASGMVQNVESYKLLIISSKYGQGGERGEAEVQLREIVTDVISYFIARPLLQFSNIRGLEPSALRALNGVQGMNISRGIMVPLTRGDEQAFWGVELTIALLTTFSVPEIWIP